MALLVYVESMTLWCPAGSRQLRVLRGTAGEVPNACNQPNTGRQWLATKPRSALQNLIVGTRERRAG